MRPCHPSHYMPLALVLPKEDQKYLLRKPLIRGNKEDALRRYFQHAHFIPIVGVGKRGEY